MSRNSNQSKGAGARLFAIVLGVIAVFSGVTYVAMLEKVEAGYVGIRVDLLGTDQGVSNDEVGPGRYWIGINEDLYRFPTFAVNYVWTQDPNEGRIYWIGGLRLPPNVVASIDSEIAATAQARQRENEVAEAIAAADKERETAAGTADAILAIATAQAEANRLLEESLTENVIQYQAMQKWDGVLPQVTGGATPMINLNDLNAAQ